MEEQARWLRWTAVLLLGAAVIGFSLILAGVFDPQPIGELQWQTALGAETAAAGTRRFVWLDRAIPAGSFSLRLTAMRRSGEVDIGYGLAIGDESDHLVIAVSPLGYAAIWRENPAGGVRPPDFLFPWRTWPHVRQDWNEIWLDGQNGRLAVRINRELMWQGEAAIGSGQIGLVMESFGETAVIEFQQLQLYFVSD